MISLYQKLSDRLITLDDVGYRINTSQRTHYIISKFSQCSISHISECVVCSVKDCSRATTIRNHLRSFSSVTNHSSEILWDVGSTASMDSFGYF